jgi:predicted Zn-dependent peptidase
MKTPKIALLGLLCALVVGKSLADEPPAHPRDLKFPELVFEPPAPEKFRVRLDNGLTAYLVPDASLPVVHVRAYVRAGGIYDPKGMEGLASVTFGLLRAGGAGDFSAKDLDTRLDDIAASIDGDAQDTRATVDAWSHARDAEELLDLFGKVLMKPRFDAKRVERVVEDTASDALSDEDDTTTLSRHRLMSSIYGKHPEGRHRTAESIQTITRDDIVAFYTKFVVPARVVLAISGSFDPETIRAKVEKLFGDWDAGGKGWAKVPTFHRKTETSVLVVDRPDMTQGEVVVGLAGIKVGNADSAALVVADHIFGSGSFTSRVVSRVRADEGLAYSIGSDVGSAPMIPGVVRTYFSCGAQETSYALKLALEEAKRLATGGPTQEELEGARAAILGRFPASFTTATDAARSLAEADLDGLPDDYYQTYRARIAAVTAEDVKRATAAYFAADGLAIVVVGPAEAVRRSLAHGTSLDDFGPVTVELKDPK